MAVEIPLSAKCIAEFVGTFMLVFTVGCNVITGQPVWGGVSIACVLMVMIYALADTSGANFNPAVSLALGISNKLGWSDVGVYMGVQLVAGIAAGFAYSAILGEAFNLQPVGDHAAWQACMAEVIYTFMLCFVVLNVACSKKHAGQNQFYGLAIGFVITAGAYSGGSVSMGCFNPAVAFGIDISSFSSGIGYCFVYTVCEFIGAAIAAGLFRVLRPEDFTEGEPPAKYELVPRLLSEFLGTYMLVLTVGLNVLAGSGAAVFSIAASLMCMIYALGSQSGANFNPAVTVAIVASGRDKLAPVDAGAYCVAQIIGGICASATYSAMYMGLPTSSFPLGPGAGYSLPQACIAEFMFTFVLCFVVLSVATVENALKENFGLAIGSCVTVGGYAVGKISGGSLNPAVSIGIASLGGGYGNMGAYVATELVAGAAAAGAFFLTQPSEFGKAEKTADAETVDETAVKKEP